MCSDGTYLPGRSRRGRRPRPGFSQPRLMAGPVATVLLFLFTAISCTVKENRAHCPCQLAVRISAVRSPPATFVCTSEQDVVAIIQVPGDTLFHVPVPRGRLLALAYAGVEGIPHPEEGCTAPPGHAFPPLYLTSAGVEVRGDSAAVHLRLHKQFCTLSLTLEGPPGWAEPYALEVEGSVCGVSLDGAPIPGSFRAPLSSSPQSDAVTVRLPRQHPADPLWLDVRMPADNILRRFNLGAVLQDAGYDWTAPDLEDLELTLELSVTAVTFRSGLWSTVIPLSITI